MLKQSIVNMRADQAAHDDITSPEHGKLLSRLNKTMDKMKKLIPTDLSDVFYELTIDYESISALMGVIEAEQAYKQGFHDGLDIAVQMIKRK